MREFFRSTFQLDAPPAEDGTFEGYASVFNYLITDTWIPTIIRPGAFTKTLQEQGSRVRVLAQHDSNLPPIGIPVPGGMIEDSKGLYVKAKLSATQRGLENLQLMRDGVLTDLSIGWDLVKGRITEGGAAVASLLQTLGIAIPVDPPDCVREVLELRLWEFSPVTWGANPPAQIIEVNAAARKSYVDMGRDGKLPDYLAPWWKHELVRLEGESHAATEKCGCTCPCDDDMPDGGTICANCYAGRHKADAQMGATAASETDAATAEQAAAAIKRETQSDSLQTLEPTVALITEAHKGAVLSAANKQIVQGAIEALQALLDAAEPPPESQAALTAEREKHRTAMSQLRELELSDLDAA